VFRDPGKEEKNKRRAVKEAKKQIRRNRRLKKSFQVADKLFLLAEFLKAKTVLFYLSFDEKLIP